MFKLSINVKFSDSKYPVKDFTGRANPNPSQRHLSPICSEDVKVVQPSYQSSHHITTWCSMTTQTYPDCLPEEASLFNYTLNPDALTTL